MKIIEPSVGLWKQGDDVKAHVAKCANVYILILLMNGNIL